MRITPVLLLLLGLLSSCSVDTNIGCSNSSTRTSVRNETTIINEAPETPPAPASTEPEREMVSSWGNLIKEELVNGCILVLDANKNTYYSNDFAWARRGFLPASTFKIPHSIIGLESGIVSGADFIFEWDGEPRRRSELDKDMDLTEAYARSCLPCYQDLARMEGQNLIQQYVDRMDYGNMVITEDNFDEFWVIGESRITPMEQIDFLQRWDDREFGFSDRTHRIMDEVMVNEETEEYTLLAKTGWSIVNETEHNGWFVGIVKQKSGARYYFATNIEPTPEYDMANFYRSRIELTKSALRMQGII